jgi:HK97 gp10 family phage protein
MALFEGFLDKADVQRSIKRLRAFGKGMVGKKLRPALRAGAKPMLAAVKANTPVLAKEKRSRGAAKRTVLRPRPRRSPRPVRGLLKRSFGIRAMKRKKDRIGVIIITVKMFKAAFYGRMLEHGTHQLAPGIRRKHRKGFAAQHGKQRIRPRKFIQKGFDATKKTSLRIIRDMLRKGVKDATAEAKRAA